MSKLFEGAAKTFSDLVDAGREYDKRIWRANANAIYGLKRYGYVTIKKKSKGNKSFFHLTPKGRLSFLKYLHLEKVRSKKWDGHWRVAIFDIPESFKKWREFLRPGLKNLGFIPLQESVYITAYPVTKDLDHFLKRWNLRKYFRYLTVTEIDDADELKRQFKLK